MRLLLGIVDECILYFIVFFRYLSNFIDKRWEATHKQVKTDFERTTRSGEHTNEDLVKVMERREKVQWMCLQVFIQL